MEKEDIEAFIRYKLRYSKKWVLNCLTYLYHNKGKQSFYSFDKDILTSLYHYYQEREHLTEKQWEIAFQCLPKYWKHYYDNPKINHSKLEKMIKEWMIESPVHFEFTIEPRLKKCINNPEAIENAKEDMLLYLDSLILGGGYSIKFNIAESDRRNKLWISIQKGGSKYIDSLLDSEITRVLFEIERIHKLRDCFTGYS